MKDNNGKKKIKIVHSTGYYLWANFFRTCMHIDDLERFSCGLHCELNWNRKCSYLDQISLTKYICTIKRKSCVRIEIYFLLKVIPTFSSVDNASEALRERFFVDAIL